MLTPRLLAPWLLILCLGMGTTVPAQAQKVELAPEVAPVCAPDAKKFCAGIRAGEGLVLDCLKKNTDALAPDCKVKVAQGWCWADIEKLCPTVEPGQGRLGQCLRQTPSLLSARCRVYQVRIKD